MRLRRSDELAGVGSRMTRRTATLLGVQPIEGESLPPWRPKEKEPVVSQRSQIAGTEAHFSGSAEQSRAPTPAPQNSSVTFASTASSSSSSPSSSSSSSAESNADQMNDTAPPNQSAEAAASSESEIRSNGSAGATVAKRTFSEISLDEAADAGAADSADADSASEVEADGDDDGDDDDDDEAEEQPLEELPQEQEQEQEQDDDFAGVVDASEQQVDETTIASAAFSLGMSDELA